MTNILEFMQGKLRICICKLSNKNPNISKTKVSFKVAKEMDKISAAEAHDVIRFFFLK